MRMNFLTYLCIGVVLLINACENKTDFEKIVSNVPEEFNSSNSNTHNYISLASKALNITSLEEGFNLIQIRIWLPFGLNDTSKLISLSKVTDDWQGEIFTFTSKVQEDTLIMGNAVVSEISPKSGWKSFIKAIINHKILVLPDMDYLNKSSFAISEGDATTVEIATRNHYRFYTYNSPTDFEDKWEEAKSMANILRLLEREFGLKILT